jgi:hypothetical protein
VPLRKNRNWTADRGSEKSLAKSRWRKVFWIQRNVRVGEQAATPKLFPRKNLFFGLQQAAARQNSERRSMPIIQSGLSSEVSRADVLLLAATILALRRARDGEPDRPTPLWGRISIGAAVGFVSGLTGVGGGVVLAPLLIALDWASPKQTAALSAPFILANSVVGLAGAMYAGQTPTADTWLFALAALSGAMIGTIVRLRWLSQTTPA